MSGLSDPRCRLLAEIANRVGAARAVRVAVDGVDGSGKTIFADELAAVLRQPGREAVRVSIDGFHHPRQRRYQRGRTSPEGFWLDSYDYPRFIAGVIVPFSDGGDRRYLPAVHDVATDTPLEARHETAAPDAVLVVDGIFLHRDELVGCWDFSVYLRAGFDTTFARMSRRDGCPADPDDPQNRRYRVGQQLYLDACDPESRADAVVDNTDPASPWLVAGRRGDRRPVTPGRAPGPPA